MGFNKYHRGTKNYLRDITRGVKKYHRGPGVFSRGRKVDADRRDQSVVTGKRAALAVLGLSAVAFGMGLWLLPRDPAAAGTFWSMEVLHRLLWSYLLSVNFVTFAAFAVDKLRAREDRWRISENCLLGLALAGGSLGGIAAMYLFWHKIRKPRFAWGLPLILLIQILLLIWLL